MRYPTVYTAPSERPKFDFLQTSNYLGEFASEVDKARVRENLGIPDEFTLYWGNIKGNIANQTDLISLINEVKQGLNNTYGVQLSSITTNIEALNANQVKQTSDIDKCTTAYTEIQTYLPELRTIYNSLAELRTDVAQNATAIQQLGGGDVTYASIPAKVSELTSAVSANTAKTSVNASNIAAAQTQINVNTTNITALQSQIAKIGDLTSVTGLQAQVDANVSQIGTLSTRCNTLDSLLTSLRDSVSTNLQDIYSLKNDMTNLDSEFDKVVAKVNNFNTNVTNLQTTLNSYNLASVVSQVNTNTADISALKTQFDNFPNQQNILARLTNLEANLSTVVITELVCSRPFVSVTAASDPILLTITAKYSNGNVQDVTNSASASSSNNSVVYWSDGAIQIAGSGTATVTFTYNGFTATSTVTVSAVEEVIPSYIGLAMTADEVVLNSSCKISSNSIGGTYTPNEVTEAPYYLWIITTKTIKTFIENQMWSYDVPGDNIEVSANTYNGIAYNVYKFHGDGLFGEADTLNEQITISITTN